MPESFGARLRQRREQRQVALSTIAETTKIKTSLLEGLERDDLSRWPGGIFRRAFVRAYAQAVGLDPDAVVREFLEVYPDPPEEVVLPAPTRLGSVVESAKSYLSGRQPEVDHPRGIGPGPVLPIAAPSVVVPDVAGTDVAAPDVTAAPIAPEPSLAAVADLCTELARLDGAGAATPLIEQAAGILDAVGIVVWLWDAQLGELRPALAHGYSDRVLAQLPNVGRDADNATATAFRSARTCIVRSDNGGNGALAVPLMAPSACVGVFAIEMRAGDEQRDAVHAVATIIAAQLARLFGSQPVDAARRLFA